MKRLLVALTVATTLAIAGPALGYNTLKYSDSWWGGDYNEIKWTSFPVKYYLNSNGTKYVPMSELEAAITEGIQVWQDPSCATITFSYGGLKSYDPGNGIYIRFMDDSWDPSVGDAAAYCMSWKYDDGTIYKAEVVYNSHELAWTTATGSVPYGTANIQGVGAHEFGHAIGLGHTRIRKATMYWTGSSDELLSLDQDDINGVCYIYPAVPFTSGQVCDSCTSASHCATGTCINYGDPDYYCGQSCTSSANCPEGYACQSVSGAGNQCIPTNGTCDQKGYGIALGDYCYGMETCESGMCLATYDDAFCSQECYGSCPSGFTCKDLGDVSYCIPAGSVSYGGDCDDVFDCADGVCVMMTMATGTCTEQCAYSSQCPNGDTCDGGYCIPTGTGVLGSECNSPADCQSGMCNYSYNYGYCTQSCTVGTDSCPGDSYCLSDATCSKPSIPEGGPCQATAECGDGLQCFMPAEDAQTGFCRYQCDAVYDNGCPYEYECSWFYQAWKDKVTGVCFPQNDGGKEGDACGGPGQTCEVNLVCAEVGDSGMTCHKDCKVGSGTGCAGYQACVSMEIASDPLHGVCHGDEVPPGPDTIEPPTDTVGPGVDTVQPGVDTIPGVDTTPGVDTSIPGVDTTGGTDTWQPGQDTTAPSSTTPVNGGPSSGCTMGAGGSQGAPSVLLILAVMVGLVLFRRRSTAR